LSLVDATVDASTQCDSITKDAAGLIAGTDIAPFASARRVDNKFFVPTANSWYIALGQNGLLP